MTEFVIRLITEATCSRRAGAIEHVHLFFLGTAKTVVITNGLLLIDNNISIISLMLRSISLLLICCEKNFFF